MHEDMHEDLALYAMQPFAREGKEAPAASM